MDTVTAVDPSLTNDEQNMLVEIHCVIVVGRMALEKEDTLTNSTPHALGDTGLEVIRVEATARG